MSSDRPHKYYLVSPGSRPPYYHVPQHLWGEDCDFDSEGDSYPDAHTTEWTELYAALRPECSEVIDIAPVDGFRLVLVIESANPELAFRAASFLQAQAGGELKDAWP